MDFLFKVEIDALNIKNIWIFYTINRMSNDDELIQQFRTWDT